MPKPVLPSDVARIARKLFFGLGTPLNLRLAEMLAKGDWDGISQVTVDPRAYQNAGSRIVAMSFCEPRSCRLQLSS